MTFEYKTVGAPEKGKRQRGARSQSDRVAAAFEEVLQAETAGGWEYLRTDLLPVTERAGWFSRGHEVHRAVMVFRRAVAPARPVAASPAPDESATEVRRAPSVAPPPAPQPAPEVSASPDLRMDEFVLGPDNLKRED